jgi:chromate transporter
VAHKNNTLSKENLMPPKNPNMTLTSLFLIFLKLGLTSFGGPVAHLGYFRDEFVSKRKFTSEKTFADIIALCQFLPGPASSQVGMCLGVCYRGLPGALAAWFGFTMPSAIALILFALGVSHLAESIPGGVIHGLKVVSVAVVALAVWGMAKKLCTDSQRIVLMFFAAIIVLIFQGPWVQVGIIGFSAALGVLFFKPQVIMENDALPSLISKKVAVSFLVAFLSLLVFLPIVAEFLSNDIVHVLDSFYRSGSLVFGGGHVVLPLLEAEFVPNGMISKDVFLAGYGATQAVPGPLFTFAAFLGSSLQTSLSPVLVGLLALFAIFLPSFLLIVGVMPFWDSLRQKLRVQSALIGVNSAVVGLLLAALYTPVWTSAILNAQDFALGLLAFMALAFGKVPVWFVVVAMGVMGWLFQGIF